MSGMISGVNIQVPWAREILEGRKTVETRTYRLPTKHIGVALALIETPGKSQNFKARIIGTVKFGESFEYKSRREFARHRSLHLVPEDDAMFGWPKIGQKWGWPVLEVVRFETPVIAPYPRGIVFASNCLAPETSL